MQVIRCRVCKAHAFTYDGDVRFDLLVASKTTFPDGTKPVRGSLVALPCGCPMSVYPSVSLYIEGEED